MKMFQLQREMILYTLVRGAESYKVKGFSGGVSNLSVIIGFCENYCTSKVPYLKNVMV